MKIGGDNMARIKITDLSKDKKISNEEMKTIMGGYYPQGGRSDFLKNPCVFNRNLAIFPIG